MENITKRIAIILKYYNLNAASFADKLGVQRSGLSHILSGRNKPSLDFIIKVTDAFEEIDVNWLLHGKGDFPRTNHADSVEASPPTAPAAIPASAPEAESHPATAESGTSSEVNKIIVFYRDGTFQEFTPRG